MAGTPAEGIQFLRDLRANNNKAWFDAHRKVYEEYLLEPAKQFVLDAGERLRKIAPGIHAEPRVQGGSILRINRDTRFSKDKSPYKNHLDFFFWEAGSGASMS